MFIQTEATPNPATLKFIPGRTVLDTGTMEFATREAAARSPLAESLLIVSCVFGVFYGYDFVTVTKADGDWQHLKPSILGAIMEHYMSGAPLMADGSAGNDEAADEEGEFFDEADAETVDTIKDLIETRVRPAVANDGGDITFRGFKDGIVYLNMKGYCAGCPSSTATLQHGIQNLLKHFVPDVVEVRPMQVGAAGWAKARFAPCPPSSIHVVAWWARRALPTLQLPDLILRSRVAASRRMNGTSRATWFETALRASSP